MAEPCRLCGQGEAGVFAHVRHREYLHCPACDLVFVSKAQLPSLAEERREYELHNNDPQEPGYRRHLEKLTGPLLELLTRNACGLDFGCGPGPSISVVLAEQGFRVADYDPIFFPERAAVLARRYDFITASEVVEHFHQPGQSFLQLAGLLVPGGHLAVMTNLRDGVAETPVEFARWFYIRETSHVAFYSRATMQWIAGRFGWSVQLAAANVTIFSKGQSR